MSYCADEHDSPHEEQVTTHPEYQSPLTDFNGCTLPFQLGPQKKEKNFKDERSYSHNQET